VDALPNFSSLIGGITSMETNGDHDQHILTQDRATMKEWNYLQQSLFNFVPTTLRASLSTRRQTFQRFIAQITETQARIWWEIYPTGSIAIGSRFFEICYQQIRYGILELTNGYLDSALMPGLPQHFANLCALLLYTAEHERFVQYQLAQLPPTISNDSRKALTPREKEVLQGLICGESECDMTRRLGLAPTTVHSHVQRLYIRLDVHSAQEAIVRAFELRLVDWLDLP
jgi:DNA-binding CsgD family transcriptional regulator